MNKDTLCQKELKVLQQENIVIEKKLKQLEGLDSIKTEFVSVVSHELRTPLSIIREITMILLQGVAGKINDQQKGLLQRCHANIERLGRLVDDLLDLSRLERGTFKLRYSLVNLKELLLDSADFFTRLAAQKGVKVKYLFPAQPINIFLDTERVQQVLSNLMTNAIKFTDPQGAITVEVKVFSDKIRIGVADNGIGIPQKDLPRLFVRFAQVPASAQVKKGLGLGLAISKEIIVKHGGEIWAESVYGKGSTFYFTLPRFYPLEAFDAPTKEKINSLLLEGNKVHLINVLLINYQKLKNLMPGHPNFSREIEQVLRRSMEEFTRTHHIAVHLVTANKAQAEFSFLVPEKQSSQVNQFYRYLRSQFRLYFKKCGVDNYFVNIGLLPYSPKDNAISAKHVPGSVRMQKLYVGMDQRKATRIEYRADMELRYAGRKVALSKTIDISERGLCYLSQVPLKTDTQIKLKLALGPQKNSPPLELQAAVAWIKTVEASQRENGAKYMVGLEFIRLPLKARQILAGFIKSNSA